MAYGPDIVLDSPAYIHPSALLYGQIHVGRGASLWPHVVARAEHSAIEIGAMTNIQDFVMIHVGGAAGTKIGAYCSITHHCTIHGCEIGDHVLVGINTTIMDGCVIGENSIIAGHSFLKEGTVIPPNSIVMGTPGKPVRQENCGLRNRMNALLYYYNGLAYAKGEHRAWSDPAILARIQDELAAYAKGIQS